jgi:hypothetical protein
MKAIRETIVQATLILLVFNLSGCAGMPMPTSGFQPLTQQQLVTGVYSALSGSQPVAFLFQHSSGLRIVMWPGATTDAETLINVACIDNCIPGWEHYVVSNGFAMTGKRASEFAAYLRAGGWHQVPLAAASAGYSSVKSWLDLMASNLTGFFIVVPVIMPVQPTEIRS